jgi:hypothetical protein
MPVWFTDWGWMVWILIGFVCYEVLTIRANDRKVSPLAVIGASALGPLMIVVMCLSWKEGKR